jgi:gluconate 2-dehydrogenase gamma chain
MDRREALKKTSLALGFALSAPVIMGVLKGCKPAPELTYKPEFFTKEQAGTISELAEIILPRTTTPGAKDVGVPGFIDRMLKEVYSPEEKEKFLTGLTEFEQDAKSEYKSSFISLDKEQQVALVKKHHDKALAGSKDSGATGWWNAGSDTDKPFILKVKELTLIGFFTSKPGATEVLQHNPVPGPYKGCVPLKDVGKAWAT